MRVYEFSRHYQITNKDLLDVLEQGGFGVGNHMKQLNDEQIAYLIKFFKLNHVLEGTAEKSQNNEESYRKKNDNSENKSVEPIIDRLKSIKDDKQGIVVCDMSLGDLAEKLSVPASELIILLLKEGVVCNKNQVLPHEIVEKIAKFYEIPIITSVSSLPINVAENIKSKSTDIHERPPIVVVIGHVDHGKTTLLDYIRRTRVAVREKGGITQHIGAYQAETKHGNIVFIDTPGHEAFTKMRQRGLKVADIAILIVAADDGVMPQTIEAIRHAKSIQVPIVVAINKVDKVDASRIEFIKGQLAQHDLLAEDWGGQITVVPISAKEGTGVNHLLELVVLQAQLMELKTNLDVSVKGFVLESKLEKGRGPVATIINNFGILKIGDYFICGKATGRVISLVDSFGKRLKSVEPAIPVCISGFNELPQVGDLFQVVPQSEYKTARNKTERIKSSVTPVLFNEESLPLIVKADSHSSREALLDAIIRLSLNQEQRDQEFNVIHAGIGDVSESDVILAGNVGATIVGFNVKVDNNAVVLAQQEKVKIKTFDIIYKLLDYLQELQKKQEVVQVTLVKTGEAIVRKVFDIKGIGVVAGSYIKDGVFSRDGIAKVWRRNKLLAEGAIKSLQRDKRTVKEVHAGYECGFLVEGFSEFQIDDRVECYTKKTI